MHCKCMNSSTQFMARPICSSIDWWLDSIICTLLMHSVTFAGCSSTNSMNTDIWHNSSKPERSVRDRSGLVVHGTAYLPGTWLASTTLQNKAWYTEGRQKSSIQKVYHKERPERTRSVHPCTCQMPIALGPSSE